MASGRSVRVCNAALTLYCTMSTEIYLGTLFVMMNIPASYFGTQTRRHSAQGLLDVFGAVSEAMEVTVATATGAKFASLTQNHDVSTLPARDLRLHRRYHPRQSRRKNAQTVLPRLQIMSSSHPKPPFRCHQVPGPRLLGDVERDISRSHQLPRVLHSFTILCCQERRP